MARFAIYFDKVNLNRNSPYTLVFEGSCTDSGGRKLVVKYTGADIYNKSSIIIPDDFMDQLKEQLNNQFRYGPFDIKVAKESLKENSSYYFNF